MTWLGGNTGLRGLTGAGVTAAAAQPPRGNFKPRITKTFF